MGSDESIDLDQRFPPQVLRQYALLADGERGALIGPHGDIAWMCAPHWDDEAVFSTLLGRGGAYAVTPSDRRHVWGGHYEPGSLIWRSRWVTCDGTVECREALAFPGRTDRAVLLRRVMAKRGTALVEVTLDLRARFGHHTMSHLSSRDGVWTGRSGPLRWRWTGAPHARTVTHAGERGRALIAELVVPEGEHHDLVLEVGQGPLPDRLTDPDEAWEATEAAWARHVPDLEHSLVPRDARHSYAVLRGLTSVDGGMVAAASMSLPERAAAGRNYDYRYAWIRDQSYAGIAAATTGATDLLDAAVGFVGERLIEDGAHLKPAYTVRGGPVPEERALDLPGYPGGDVKTGNWVNSQFQLDALGEALQLFAAAAAHDRLDAQATRAAQIAVAAIESTWTREEAGIWELDDRHWTQSRLACVAGLRSIVAVPGAGLDLATATGLADQILASTSSSSLHATGYWQRAPAITGVDASLVLPPVRGALPAGDPRTTATLAAVRAQLGRDGFIYRFRHDQRDLGEAEGAFVLCGLMMALAEHQQGNPVQALRYFERNRSVCGPPGLFSEEYDVTERQLRGNLPQAFVHAMLLQCSTTLDAEPHASGITR